MTPRLIAFLTAQLFVLLTLFAQNMAVAQIMASATVAAAALSPAQSVADPSAVDAEFAPAAHDLQAPVGEQEHAGNGQDAGSLEWPELALNSTAAQARTEPLELWQAQPCRLPVAPALEGPQRPPQGLASRLPG
ncbi:hypothetical protein LNV23_13930 [Paucibacter sp. DJ1R-11]|uniref:hypothetical protein n=1 Tax=Paucibacter sp. DJ1R-11 TaxID=2893556 RepID=UPI0021E4FF1F|nr:hypothetical protein [Paucibacter sp. DJ1R-11]MCV2364548.1 hypothetical protein [Paucibacter sp. DJ1R-11]